MAPAIFFFCFLVGSPWQECELCRLSMLRLVNRSSYGQQRLWVYQTNNKNVGARVLRTDRRLQRSGALDSGMLFASVFTGASLSPSTTPVAARETGFDPSRRFTRSSKVNL